MHISELCEEVYEDLNGKVVDIYWRDALTIFFECDDWVDWLLGGRILYAYSGSDTHDAALAFGANHAVFEGEPFTVSNLEAALKAGRSFISNGHVLILEAEVDGVVLDMGTLQALSPNQPATSVTVRAHYNFGADTSAITIFRGAVGDAAETILCQSGPLTGEGVFACNDSLDTVNRTWLWTDLIWENFHLNLPF